MNVLIVSNLQNQSVTDRQSTTTYSLMVKYTNTNVVLRFITGYVHKKYWVKPEKDKFQTKYL